LLISLEHRPRLGVVQDDRPECLHWDRAGQVQLVVFTAVQRVAVEGARLVGDVGVECDARFVAVPGVDIADRFSG
jgi:hypothetical protein